MELKNSQKTLKNYECKNCDYITSRKSDFTKHISTAKHIKTLKIESLELIGIKKLSDNQILNENNNSDCISVNNKQQDIKSKHICIQCNCEFKTQSGLWKHKKKCVIINNQDIELQNTFNNTTITPNLFMEVLKQSKELQNVLIEQNKELQNKLLEKENKLLEKDNILIEQNNKIIELASKPTNINSHNTNNQFNLQFFLNETCKDAMNIVDFVNSLKLTIDDFETTGKLGFIDGISRIFIKELKKLETEKLPIHCTDLKRENVYIKDNNIWEKENEEKQKLKWAIDRIAQLNLNQVQNWQQEYPECIENNTRENEYFFKLAAVALGGRGKDEQDKCREKIMRNVLKEVVLDKHSKVLK
jgi:hypothetical protein